MLGPTERTTHDADHAERERMNAFARERSTERTNSQEYHLGFHGDRYLLGLVDSLMPQVTAFVESGANMGNTAIYVGKTYPRVRVRSCEPGIASFAVASRRAREFPNVSIVDATSPGFIESVLPDPARPDRPDALGADDLPLFWLDAHGYGFHWPLWDEIDLITARLPRALVLIDDLLVPGRPQFGFDEYDGQVCSLAALAPRINPAREYVVVYPAYTDRTSEFHPLRGYGLLAFGDVRVDIPPALAGKFEMLAWRPTEPA